MVEEKALETAAKAAPAATKTAAPVAAGGAAKAAPAATTGAAKTATAGAAKAAPAAATGAAKTVGVASTAKAVLLSPLFGVALLGGIIAWEWWKGSKDAREFSTAKA